VKTDRAVAARALPVSQGDRPPVARGAAMPRRAGGFNDSLVTAHSDSRLRSIRK
jgi:hypothetical protein